MVIHRTLPAASCFPTLRSRDTTANGRRPRTLPLTSHILPLPRLSVYRHTPHHRTESIPRRLRRTIVAFPKCSCTRITRHITRTSLAGSVTVIIYITVSSVQRPQPGLREKPVLPRLFTMPERRPQVTAAVIVLRNAADRVMIELQVGLPHSLLRLSSHTISFIACDSMTTTYVKM